MRYDLGQRLEFVQQQQQGHIAISDRAFAWVLGITLIVGALTNYSPLLHLVLRHGSFDLTEAHLHSGSLSSHPLQEDVSNIGGPTGLVARNTDSSDQAHEPEDNDDSPRHEHHGLPELLLLGMVDVTDADSHPKIWAFSRPERSLYSASFSPAASFDPTRAPRPPPLLATLH